MTTSTRRFSGVDPRPAVAAGASGLGGASPAAQISGMPEELIRLHASENPYGSSAAVGDVVASELCRLNRYPDPSSEALVGAIARHHGVSPDMVSVGNGVDEVILFLALVLGRDDKPGVITDATFQSYLESLSVARRSFVSLPLDGYRVPTKAIADRMLRGAPFAFVCNPHNPTGSVLQQRELELLQRAATSTRSTLIVDEAYAEYAGETFASAIPMAAECPHVCVLRTFSKAYGLAGLRVGYVIGHPHLISRINAVHGPLPYHVNRLAQSAAVAALADQDFVRRTTRAVIATREWFRNELVGLGLRCLPSAANFLLVDFGPDSQAVARALGDRGFRVRDTGGMGLPGHLRISIGTPEQIRKMRDALAAMFVRPPNVNGCRQP